MTYSNNKDLGESEHPQSRQYLCSFATGPAMRSETLSRRDVRRAFFLRRGLLDPIGYFDKQF